MTTFKDFIVSESINDKGILKAIFVIGSPGAGKSYTVKHMSGVISPVVVNTDRATEFLSTKHKELINSLNWPKYEDSAHRITKNQLFGYVNGMLPLFVDGTSNDVSNILYRAGLLESVGYDVGIVFVDVDLETALKRVKARAEKVGRDVDETFVRKVQSQVEENKNYLKNKVSFFRSVNNVGDATLDNEDMIEAFKAAQEFFSNKVNNPVGKRLIEKLTSSKEKYLVPTVMSQEELANKIEGWYKK